MFLKSLILATNHPPVAVAVGAFLIPAVVVIWLKWRFEMLNNPTPAIIVIAAVDVEFFECEPYSMKHFRAEYDHYLTHKSPITAA